MKRADASADFRRRNVLRGIGASALAASIPGKEITLFAQSVAPAKDATDREHVRALLDPLFTSPDPRVTDLVRDAYADCILGKVRPADPPLAHSYIVPGGGYYAQWLWDTMFVLDLLSILPGQAETIRGVFQNYWDFQQRWNRVKPAFMHGMIANFMAPFDAPKIRSGLEWETFPAYSQAPLLAWGMERVFKRNHDMALLSAGLQPLEDFHDWYWRERDVTNCGLIGVGAYSGDPQHARYETYDREVDLDGLKMTPHPGRSSSPENGAWYGDILIPANTAYLLLSELSLARLANVAGNDAMARRRRAIYDKGAHAMRDYMWSQQFGCFLAVRRDTHEPILPATVGGFMALQAGVPTASQAATMASALGQPDWATPLPIPTVASSNPKFVSSEFWRGDMWPAPNFQVASGLAAYGHHDAAARIADLTVANAIKVGISERYDSMTGAPLGVKGLGMSAIVVTMMLEGLTRKHQLQLKSHAGIPLAE
jgi:glycogen debranching enzyme